MSFFTSEYTDMHNLPDQQKRRARAVTVPVGSVDRATQTGIINGYRVSLDNCTCMDFSTRALPCKHMYRLAMELGVFDTLDYTTIDVAPFTEYKGFRDLSERNNPYLAYIDIVLYNEIGARERQVDIIARHPEYTKSEVTGALSRLERHNLIKKSREGRLICWEQSSENYLIGLEDADFPVVFDYSTPPATKEEMKARFAELMKDAPKKEASVPDIVEPVPKKAGCLVYFGFLLGGMVSAVAYFIA